MASKIHDKKRMPVILRDENLDEWLNPENQDTDRLKKFLVPYPDEKMTAYEVSRAVNSTQNNSKELLDPIN